MDPTVPRYATAIPMAMVVRFKDIDWSVEEAKALRGCAQRKIQRIMRQRRQAERKAASMAQSTQRLLESSCVPHTCLSERRLLNFLTFCSLGVTNVKHRLTEYAHCKMLLISAKLFEFRTHHYIRLPMLHGSSVDDNETQMFLALLVLQFDKWHCDTQLSGVLSGWMNVAIKEGWYDESMSCTGCGSTLIDALSLEVPNNWRDTVNKPNRSLQYVQ